GDPPGRIARPASTAKSAGAATTQSGRQGHTRYRPTVDALPSPRELGDAVLMPEQGAASRLGYEQARDQLAELVKRLEAGGLTWEQSLGLWERGEQLAAICEEWLEGARARLAAATKPPDDDSDRDGDPGRPF